MIVYSLNKFCRIRTRSSEPDAWFFFGFFFCMCSLVLTPYSCLRGSRKRMGDLQRWNYHGTEPLIWYQISSNGLGEVVRAQKLTAMCRKPKKG